MKYENKNFRIETTDSGVFISHLDLIHMKEGEEPPTEAATMFDWSTWASIRDLVDNARPVTQ